MTDSALGVVLAWHTALNEGDVERLVALSAEDVEVGGPRGSGRGSDLLREWFGRVGVRIEPLRTFVREQTVVVEQDATWPHGEPQRVASAFEVRGGRVARVIRHANLPAALQAAGLDDEAGITR
jgi:ketosteroid isomerase-like protein